MAMAPMQTVRDAVTKALIKRESPALPVRFRRKRPKDSNFPSISAISPISVPRTILTIIIMVPPAVRTPFGETVKTFASVPDMPINRVQTPATRVTEVCHCSFRNFPNNKPMTPPPMMAATFMMVPNPIIIFLSGPGTYCVSAGVQNSFS